VYAITPLICDLGEDRLRSRIAGCNGLELAERCSYLNAAVTEAQWMRGMQEAQGRFMDLLGHDPCREQVIKHLAQADGSVIVDPQALEVMCAFALLWGTGEATLERFLESLMGLTFETLREPGTQRIRDDATGIYSAISATMMFGTDRYLNTRWRLRQFIEWSRTREGRLNHAYVDLDAELQNVLGMTYDVLVTAIAVIDMLTDFDVMRHRGSASFGNKDIARWDRFGNVARLLSSVAISRDSFAEQIGAAPLHEMRSTLVRVLTPSPVIALKCERYLVPSGRVADNLASLGWVYALADARRLQDPSLSARLWSFFGYFYEWYITEIIRRIAARCSSKFWREQDLGGFKTSDSIVRQGNEVQFFEVVSSRPNANLLRCPCSDEIIERELERLVLGKVDQLAENARRYRANQFASFGADAMDGDIIYPVLVQYKSFSKTPELQERIQERFLQRLGDAAAGNVRQIELLDAEILEALEAHLTPERTLGTLLDEKSGDPEMRLSVFKNFLSSRHPELPLRVADEIQAADRDWQEEIRVRVAEWTVA
jgi:hypothetical protein